MPPFPEPAFDYAYQASAQRDALRHYRDTKDGRKIPAKAAGRLLLATWNIANLGVQKRRAQDYQLIAEILSWFELIAVQESNDNLDGIRAIQAELPDYYRLLFSDAAGNNERMTFVYDSRKVRQLEEIGELAIPPSDLTHLKLSGSDQHFEGFDRNPHLALFEAGSFTLQLANVHLYFGSGSATSMNRRRLETLAVADWAQKRRKSPYASTPNILALGDFNLPKSEPGDPIFDELTSRGLYVPPHATQIGSSIADEGMHYDQIAFFPGDTQDHFQSAGVYDYDGALFQSLFQDRGRKDFLAYCRYYISDHRPLWAEFAT